MFTVNSAHSDDQLVCCTHAENVAYHGLCEMQESFIRQNLICRILRAKQMRQVGLYLWNNRANIKHLKRLSFTSQER